jgi:hypothetical protein
MRALSLIFLLSNDGERARSRARTVGLKITKCRITDALLTAHTRTRVGLMERGILLLRHFAIM